MTREEQTQQTYGEMANKFEFGSNPSAELWNGRLAMIGFLSAILIELLTGKGLLTFWGLM